MAVAPQRSSAPVWGVLLVAALCVSGCSGGAAPDLLPVSPATVGVNELLRIPLRVQNPSGVALTWTYSGPELPSLDTVAHITGTPTGGEFAWTPLVSHVGTHQFQLAIASTAGSDAEAVVITVTPAASAAPIFLSPGAGGTYDLGRSECVRFSVDIKDDDSEHVVIRARRPLPDGATLSTTGSKQARFEWCPLPAQIDQSQRWTIALEADDGEHVATSHDYVIVLRTQTDASCPGEPPQITVLSPAEGERVSSAAGYDVLIDVRDESLVRSAPVLLHSITPPANIGAPDVSGFEQELFEPAGEVKGRWIATIPPLELAPGEGRLVYFQVSVTDDDDPEGTACDHRTDTPLRSFFAQRAPELAATCEPCIASDRCASGVCLAGASGGVCAPDCPGPPVTCQKGTCGDHPTVEGTSAASCGPPAVACGEPELECTDDHEPNDSIGRALDLNFDASGFAQVQSTICARDTDLWRIVAHTEGEHEIVLTDFDVLIDLDLGLLDASGADVDDSASTAATERIKHCMREGDIAYASVYAFDDTEESPYVLRAIRTEGSCCEDDALEPDSKSLPRTLPSDGVLAGITCGYDVDYYRIPVSGPTDISAEVAWSSGDPAMMMELVLFMLDGTFVASSSSAAGATGIATLVHASEGGDDLLLGVVPQVDARATYDGAVSFAPRTPADACNFTFECVAPDVCRDGRCVDPTCSSTSVPCPVDHDCSRRTMLQPEGVCAARCILDGECRLMAGEQCKWLEDGRNCALTGSGRSGDPCERDHDCEGNLGCYNLMDGYCAKAGCESSADCEPGTRCAGVALSQDFDVPVCLRECGEGLPACRAPPYECATTLERVSGDIVNLCMVPSPF